ncbi:MAG: 50S ribosomal protein L31e [Candidatus Heimdallarchaeota archaeon]
MAVEETVIEERIYTIPFYPKLTYSKRVKRAPRAIRILREFVQRHMKATNIIIAPEVNKRIWSKGREKPPRRIRVRCLRTAEDKIEVHLLE